MTLKEFLKEKRALTKFRVNHCLQYTLIKRTKADAENHIKVFADSVNAIVAAFPWCDSQEGYDYWKTLDDEWTAICNQK